LLTEIADSAILPATQADAIAISFAAALRLLMSQLQVGPSANGALGAAGAAARVTRYDLVILSG
jgi:hypothetical protein